jgi:hypothetical protein
VICFNKTIESGEHVNDCELHIEANLGPEEVRVFTIKYNKEADLMAKKSKELEIRSRVETISFTDETKDEGLLFILKKEDKEEFLFTFDLRYYQADQGGDNYTDSDNCPSGAYIFKPAKDQQSSLPYSAFKDIKVFDGGFV